MSFLSEFGDELYRKLEKLPFDERTEVLTFAKNAVFQSYKNGFDKGREERRPAPKERKPLTTRTRREREHNRR